ncbi:MAG: hypothetical protein H3C34_16695 [Caldilineaceae bacterium]|nr:hypothetical protein [Caldilineaceae bacterium]
MDLHVDSPYLSLLKDRVNLSKIPFSERGSRLMVFRTNDHLSVRLAERWFKLDQQLSGYRKRQPILTDWAITDENGSILPLTTTSYPHCVVMTTDKGAYCLLFVDPETLLLTLPAGRHGIRFRANLDNLRKDRRGGILRLTGDIRRNIAYTTNAQILAHEVDQDSTSSHTVRMVFACENDCALMINITPRLGFNRHIPEVASAIDAAARRWHDWFASVPPVKDEYRAQYYYAWWVMRSGLISSRFYTTREAMTPSKIHYVGVWHWDAFFHALAYRHVEPRLAQDQIRIVLDHQREDGMIPDAVHDEGVVTRLTFPVEADVTKPPLLAWCAWKLYEMDGDREFLDEIYEPVVHWNRWWFEQNDADHDGLCEYQHPFSSGLDDSPLWDDGMPVTAPDLNTYLVLQEEALARIAETIGLKEEAKGWSDKAAQLAQQMIDRLWDPEAGIFWAYHKDKRVNVRTPFNLFPLISGRLPEPIAKRLLAHLIDPKQFWTHHPVPTVACDDPKYDPVQMWRGPTWVNINYLLMEGLERIGQYEIASELRRRTLDMMVCGDDFYEYYHPQTGDIPPKAAPIFGWSSALYIEMAIAESKAQGS